MFDGVETHVPRPATLWANRARSGRLFQQMGTELCYGIRLECIKVPNFNASPQNYFRRGFLFWSRLECSLPNRFAFAATRFRYRWTILSPEAPAIRLAVASRAASIFSRTIRSACTGRLCHPASVSSSAALQRHLPRLPTSLEVNFRASVRRGLKRGTLCILQGVNSGLRPETFDLGG